MVHCRAVVLCAHARQARFFRFRYPQTVKSVFNVLRHIVPTARALVFHFGVIANFVQIQSAQIRSPSRQAFALKNLQTLQPVFQHPIRFVVFLPNMAHHALVQSFLRGKLIADSFGSFVQLRFRMFYILHKMI